MGTVADPLVHLNRPSHSQESGDALTLAEREKALISDHLAIADLILIPLNNALACHALEQQGDSGACLFRHSQRLINLSGAETVTGLVGVHRKGAKHCPLIGCAECLAIGNGSEHCSVV